MLHELFFRLRLLRYTVTVMDGWTPMREFWTFRGAKKFYDSHRSCAHLYHWQDGEWIEKLPASIKTPGNSNAST